MATLREIRGRIVGIKSTQKITQAMKMVAAAKLRRAQDNIISARPYAKKMDELTHNLITKVNPEYNPLLAERAVKRILIIVVTSDRGMCGAFNTNIIKKAVELIDNNYSELYKNNNIELLCIGKKGYQFFSKRNYTIYKSYINIFSRLDYSIAKDISNSLIESFISEKFDKIEVVYNEFKSVIQQNLLVEQLLPFEKPTIKKEEKHIKSLVDFIYEPNPKEIVNEIIPKHINTKIWRILLESYAAEEGSRMTAMDNANENAKEMISELNLQFNKARQASITTEILEIISGANALQEA
ncbi:MAG TPA: ATP synthase F1 subunit gamma [Ignavibacteria bacterium]|jgi:F-type H+-transporting ATPase subunit gamma